MSEIYQSGYVVTLTEPLTIEEEHELREYLKFRRSLNSKPAVNYLKVDTCIVCAQGDCCCTPKNNWRKK